MPDFDLNSIPDIPLSPVMGARRRPSLSTQSDDLPDDLVSGILRNESGGRHYDAHGNVLLGPPTRSGARAVGRWQVMPDAGSSRFRTIGRQRYDLHDEAQNERAGRAYLQEGLTKAQGDPKGAALYYFAGPGGLQHYQRTGRLPAGSDKYTSIGSYVKQATSGTTHRKFDITSVPDVPLTGQAEAPGTLTARTALPPPTAPTPSIIDKSPDEMIMPAPRQLSATGEVRPAEQVTTRRAPLVRTAARPATRLVRPASADPVAAQAAMNPTAVQPRVRSTIPQTPEEVAQSNASVRRASGQQRIQPITPAQQLTRAMQGQMMKPFVRGGIERELAAIPDESPERKQERASIRAKVIAQQAEQAPAYAKYGPPPDVEVETERRLQTLDRAKAEYQRLEAQMTPTDQRIRAKVYQSLKDDPYLVRAIDNHLAQFAAGTVTELAGSLDLLAAPLSQATNLGQAEVKDWLRRRAQAVQDATEAAAREGNYTRTERAAGTVAGIGADLIKLGLLSEVGGAALPAGAVGPAVFGGLGVARARGENRPLGEQAAAGGEGVATGALYNLANASPIAGEAERMATLPGRVGVRAANTAGRGAIVGGGTLAMTGDPRAAALNAAFAAGLPAELTGGGERAPRLSEQETVNVPDVPVRTPAGIRVVKGREGATNDQAIASPVMRAEAGADREDITAPASQTWQTGQPRTFTYVRNTEKAPKLGAYQQDIEPSGQYMSEIPSDLKQDLPDNWERGTATFNHPLVLDWGQGYDETGWKHRLSQMYGGKTGAELSKAVAQDGYDGIVTMRDGEAAEIVDLHHSLTQTRRARNTKYGKRGQFSGPPGDIQRNDVLAGRAVAEAHPAEVRPLVQARSVAPEGASVLPTQRGNEEAGVAKQSASPERRAQERTAETDLAYARATIEDLGGTLEPVKYGAGYTIRLGDDYIPVADIPSAVSKARELATKRELMQRVFPEQGAQTFYAGVERGKPVGTHVYLTSNPEYAKNFGAEIKQYPFKPTNTLDLTETRERALSLAQFKRLLKTKGVDIADFKGDADTPEEYQTTKPLWQWLRRFPALVERVKAAGFDSIAQQETFTGQGRPETTYQVLDSSKLQAVPEQRAGHVSANASPTERGVSGQGEAQPIAEKAQVSQAEYDEALARIKPLLQQQPEAPEVKPVLTRAERQAQAKADKAAARINRPPRTRPVPDSEKHSLSDFVRLSGGIRPDADNTNAGELRRLSPREIGGRHIGLVNKNGMTADEVSELVHERGYFTERPDPNALLEAIEADARGRQHYSSHNEKASAAVEAEYKNYVATHPELGPMERRFEAFHADGATGDLYERMLYDGTESLSAQELTALRQKARQYGVESEIEHSIADNSLAKQTDDTSFNVEEFEKTGGTAGVPAVSPSGGEGKRLERPAEQSGFGFGTLESSLFAQGGPTAGKQAEAERPDVTLSTRERLIQEESDRQAQKNTGAFGEDAARQLEELAETNDRAGQVAQAIIKDRARITKPIADTVKALRAIREAQSNNTPLNDHLKQQGLFGESLTPEVQNLARRIASGRFNVSDLSEPVKLARLTPTEKAKVEAAQTNLKRTITHPTHDINEVIARALPDLVTIGKYHILNGAREFKDFSRKMVEQFGEQIRPHLERLHKLALAAAGEKDVDDTSVSRTADVGRSGRSGSDASVSEVRQREPAIEPTGTKNAVTERERAERGLSPVEKQAYTAIGESYLTGKSAVESGSIDPRALAQSIANRPRPLSATEVGALGHDRARLINEHRAAIKSVSEAIDGGNTEGALTAKDKLERIEQDFDVNDQALQKGGREQSAAFNARKMLIKEDYSLAEIINRAKTAKGEKLTEDERAKFTELSTKLEAAESKIAEYESKKSERASEQQAKESVTRMQREAQGEVRRARRSADRQTLDTEFAALRAQFAKARAEMRGVQPSGLAGLDPEGKLTKLVYQMAKNRVKAGVNTVEGVVDEIHGALKEHIEGLTKRDVRDAISGYGITQEMNPEQTAKQLRELKAQMRLISAYEDAQAGQRPLRSGLQRDKPTTEVRDLQRQVREVMREHGVEIEAQDVDPEAQQKSALDSLKTRLRNEISDLDRRVVRRTRTPVAADTEAEALRAERDLLKRQVADPTARNKADLQKRLAEAERKLKTGEVDKETNFPRSIYDDAEAVQMRARLSDLNKQLSNARLTPERQAEVARKGLEREIAELERRIGAQDFSKRQGKPPLSTPELEQLRARKAELRAEYDKLKPVVDPLPGIKKKLKKQIADLQGKIDRGEFTKAPQRERVPLDRDGMRLAQQRDTLKAQVDTEILRIKRANRTRWAKIKEGAVEGMGIPRTVKASVDLSGPRQAAMFMVTHPKQGAKLFFWRQLKAMRAQNFADYNYELKQHPRYEQMKESGLDMTSLTAHDLDPTKREEGFVSNILTEDRSSLADSKSRLVRGVERTRQAVTLPVRASNRAYAQLLTDARVSWFDQLSGQAERVAQAKGTKVTPEQYKAIAEFVNIGTGRGNLGHGKLNQISPVLNALFFAPRYAASKVQVFDPRVYARLPPGARSRAMGEAVGYFATMATTALLLKHGFGLQVGTDPEDSDFMKLTVGKTHYDLSFGQGQYVVLAARLLKNADNARLNKTDEWGKTAWDNIKRFASYKLSPPAGFVRTTYPRMLGNMDVPLKDVVGQPTTFKREALQLITPLFLNDLYEAYKQEGGRGMVKTAPGFVGVGVQTYAPKTSGSTFTFKRPEVPKPPRALR